MSFFHHLLLPRESNNHRAKILHHHSLLGLIALLLIGQFAISFVGRHTSGILGAISDVSIADLLSQTNKVRQEHGLSTLTLNSQLASAATAKGHDMLTHNYWAHNSPEGLTPWVFIKNAQYDYFYAGENLARGFSSASSVMNAWMASPGHRANILSPHYKDIGFAVLSGTLTGEDTMLVVEEFGSKNTSEAETAGSVAPISTAVSETLVPSPIMMHSKAVEAARIKPLSNTKSITEPIAISILLILIGILLLDIVIIEKKKIVRLFSHNLDHIIYLVILLIIILIMGRGLTL